MDWLTLSFNTLYQTADTIDPLGWVFSEEGPGILALSVPEGEVSALGLQLVLAVLVAPARACLQDQVSQQVVLEPAPDVPDVLPAVLLAGKFNEVGLWWGLCRLPSLVAEIHLLYMAIGMRTHLHLFNLAAELVVVPFERALIFTATLHKTRVLCHRPLLLLLGLLRLGHCEGWLELVMGLRFSFPQRPTVA